MHGADVFEVELTPDEIAKITDEREVERLKKIARDERLRQEEAKTSALHESLNIKLTKLGFTEEEILCFVK